MCGKACCAEFVLVYVVYIHIHACTHIHIHAHPPSDQYTYTHTSYRCGDDHTLILLRSGELFAVGGNSYGQLGLGDTIDRALPVVLAGLADEKVCIHRHLDV